MTTTQAIIERLRARITIHLGDDGRPATDVLDEAAGELERLAAVNADLLAALRGFVDLYVPDPKLWPEDDAEALEGAHAAIAKAEAAP